MFKNREPAFTYLAETPFYAGMPLVADVVASQVSLLRERGAHFGSSQLGFQDGLGRNVDDDDGVNDGHGAHHAQHHGAEKGQAQVLLASLRRVLDLGHPDSLLVPVPDTK